MIAPVMTHDGYIRWHTKRGLSDTAMRAEVFVAKNPQYQDFARRALLIGSTPIFEWVSRKDKIVLDYEEDNLILVAMRDMTSGLYATHDNMKNMMKPYNISVVDQHDPEKMTTEQLIETIGGLENTEGVVIRFNDGHMLKVKSQWYCDLHRAVSNVVWEYNMVKIILDNKLDDLKAVLRQHNHPLADEIEEYEKEFWGCFDRIVDSASKKLGVLENDFGDDRKAIATSDVMKKVSPIIRMLIFKALDGKDIRDTLVTNMQKNITRNTAWQNLKACTVFNELKWNGRGG